MRVTINFRPRPARPGARHMEALSWRRSLILAVVLALHLGLLLALLQPAEPWVWPRADDTRRDALQVWLTYLATGSSHRMTGHPDVPPPHRAKPLPAVVARPSVPATAASRVIAPADAPSAEPVTATVPRRLVLPGAAAIIGAAPGYIAGGGRLSPPQVASGSVIDSHLPGRDGGLPGVVMADPQQQGVAGAVRLIRDHLKLMGATDRACIDVAVWRGMTTQELLDHHLDENTVEALAARHGCGLKPEAPFHGWRDFGAPVH